MCVCVCVHISSERDTGHPVSRSSAPHIRSKAELTASPISSLPPKKIIPINHPSSQQTLMFPPACPPHPIYHPGLPKRPPNSWNPSTPQPIPLNPTTIITPLDCCQVLVTHSLLCIPLPPAHAHTCHQLSRASSQNSNLTRYHSSFSSTTWPSRPPGLACSPH